MKKLLSVFALIGLLFTVNAFAQQGDKVQKIRKPGIVKAYKPTAKDIKTAEQLADEYTEGNVRKLNLSSKQEAKIYDIHVKYNRQIERLRDHMSLTDPKFRAEWAKINENRFRAIRSVLTNAQAREFDRINERSRERRGGR